MDDRRKVTASGSELKSETKFPAEVQSGMARASFKEMMSSPAVLRPTSSLSSLHQSALVSSRVLE